MGLVIVEMGVVILAEGDKFFLLPNSLIRILM